MTLSTGRLSGRPNQEETEVADEKDTAGDEWEAPNPELTLGGDGDPDDQIVVIDGVRYRKDETEQLEAAKARAAAKKKVPSNKARSASDK